MENESQSFIEIVKKISFENSHKREDQLKEEKEKMISFVKQDILKAAEKGNNSTTLNYTLPRSVTNFFLAEKFLIEQIGNKTIIRWPE